MAKRALFPLILLNLSIKMKLKHISNITLKIHQEYILGIYIKTKNESRIQNNASESLNFTFGGKKKQNEHKTFKTDQELVNCLFLELFQFHHTHLEC